MGVVLALKAANDDRDECAGAQSSTSADLGEQVISLSCGIIDERQFQLSRLYFMGANCDLFSWRHGHDEVAVAAGSFYFHLRTISFDDCFEN